MASTSGFIAGLGKVRLTLELTPQPTPSGGDILAVAMLIADRDQVPLAGQTVTFYHGADEAASEPTHGDGRISNTFLGLGFGMHAISVQVAGVSVTQRHTFIKPAAEQINPPAELKVYAHPQGPAKEYYVSVELIGGQGPVKQWPIEIKDPAHITYGKRVRVAKSAEDGAHRFTVETKRPREVFISVVGTPLEFTLRLPGPTRRKFYKPSEPTEKRPKTAAEEHCEAACAAGERWMGKIIAGFKTKQEEPPPRARAPLLKRVFSRLQRVGSMGARVSQAAASKVFAQLRKVGGRIRRAISSFRERRRATEPTWKRRISR